MTDRDAAIARARELAAARSAPSQAGDPDTAHDGAGSPRPRARPTQKGPSAGRILAAAAATAAGVGLVGVLAAGAQHSNAAPAEPAQPVEYRTVVVQVPEGSQPGDRLTTTVAVDRVAPGPAAADRAPATQTEGS